MLTTAGIRETYGYDIDDDRGTIRSPGKFEGEPWFIVALWDACLDGCEGEPEDNGYWFQIREDSAEFFQFDDFPKLDRETYAIGRWIWIWEDDQGFVRHHMHDQRIETVTGDGLACWASYLINGDASGIDDDDKRAADAFAEWLGGDIVDASEDSFFAVPDAGTTLAGDCVTYTAVVRRDN